MAKSENEIKMLLRYGYVPKVDQEMQEVLRSVCRHEKFDDFSFSSAHEILCELIYNHVNTSKAHKLLIPCGGGMDSRVLLGAARDVVDCSRIELVTYGADGQLDYRIGKKVAELSGLTHHEVNLFDLNWTELIKHYDGEGWYIEKVLNKFGLFDLDNYITLIGFMGDPSTGSHLQSKKLSKSKALEIFDQKNVFTKGSRQVKLENLNNLSEFDHFDDSLLSYYEQLDFSVRQSSYIKNIFPNHQNVFFPFATIEWLSVTLNLCHERRQKQDWYHCFVQSAYPDLFKIGLKSTYGLNIKETSKVKSVLWGYNKILSILTGKKFGLERQNANYMNFYDRIPHTLSQLEDRALNDAFSVYPYLETYNFDDPMFRSLASSLRIANE